MKYALWFTILLLVIYIIFPGILPLWLVMTPVIIFGFVPIVLFFIMAALAVVAPALLCLAILFYILKG